MIDFTNCKMIPGRAYNGANGSKIAVSFHDAVYMLKFPPSGQRNCPIRTAASVSILQALFLT